MMIQSAEWAFLFKMSSLDEGPDGGPLVLHMLALAAILGN